MILETVNYVIFISLPIVAHYRVSDHEDWCCVQRVKPPFVRSASHRRVLVWIPAGPHLVQLSDSATREGAEGPSSTWDTRLESQAPGFHLSKTWLVRPFEEWTKDRWSPYCSAFPIEKGANKTNKQILGIPGPDIFIPCAIILDTSYDFQWNLNPLI